MLAFSIAIDCSCACSDTPHAIHVPHDRCRSVSHRELHHRRRSRLLSHDTSSLCDRRCVCLASCCSAASYCHRCLLSRSLSLLFLPCRPALSALCVAFICFAPPAELIMSRARAGSTAQRHACTRTRSGQQHRSAERKTDVRMRQGERADHTQTGADGSAQWLPLAYLRLSLTPAALPRMSFPLALHPAPLLCSMSCPTSTRAHRRLHAVQQQLCAGACKSMSMSHAAAHVHDTAATAVAATAGVNIAVSTHVLDTSTGIPASNVRVWFERCDASGQQWTLLGEARTNSDGRVGHETFPPIATTDATADYRFRFDSGEYFRAQGHSQPFFPMVTLQWQVSQERDAKRTKLHVPLLLSPFGYSSYRGS